MIKATTPNKLLCLMYEESRATCCDTLTFIDTYAECAFNEYAKISVFTCDISISIYSLKTGKFLRKRNFEFFIS